jgi:hypothetical protein
MNKKRDTCTNHMTVLSCTQTKDIKTHTIIIWSSHNAKTYYSLTAAGENTSGDLISGEVVNILHSFTQGWDVLALVAMQ